MAVTTFTKRALFQKTQKKRGQVTNAKCKARKGYGGQTCLGLSETTRWASVSIGGGSRTCGIEEESRRLHCWGATHFGSSDWKTASRETFFKEKGVKDPIKVRCLWSRLVTDRWSGRGSKAHGLQPPSAAVWAGRSLHHPTQN